MHRPKQFAHLLPTSTSFAFECLLLFLLLLFLLSCVCASVCVCVLTALSIVWGLLPACQPSQQSPTPTPSPVSPLPPLPLPYPRWLPGNFVNYKSFAFGSMLMSLPGTTPTSSAILLPMSRMTTMCVCALVCVCVYFCITYATFYNSDSYATPPAHCPARNTRVVVLLCFIFYTHN